MISDMSDDEVNTLFSVLGRPDYFIEKRRYSRMRYTVPMDCMSHGRSIRARLRDLSVGGVFIETMPLEDPFVIGQEILLCIPYPNKEKQARIQGKVIRATLNGVGVAFGNMGAESV